MKVCGFKVSVSINGGNSTLVEIESAEMTEKEFIDLIDAAAKKGKEELEEMHLKNEYNLHNANAKKCNKRRRHKKAAMNNKNDNEMKLSDVSIDDIVYSEFL